MRNIIEIENLSKQYRLGQLGTGTISHDLNRFWHKVRGKEDPYLKVTQKNDRTKGTKNNYVWALQDVSFSVKEGEVLGIIGKNGAGKSTLLKLLSRITSPTKGSIKIKGRMSSLLEVGTGFHPELTGRENIFLNGAILGMTKAEIRSKLDEIIEFSGCAAYIDTPVKRYSSGMIVRLGFAVAAHLESEILVVDEVLAVGDLAFQQKCIGKMKDISKSGRTVLFVSHNLNSVANLCDTGILMENGKLTYSGKVTDVIQKYLDSNQVENHNVVDLTKFEDREGSGEIKFNKIEFFKNQEPTNSIMIGDDLTIKITVESTQKMNLIFAMHIFNYEQTQIANIENTDSNIVIPPFIGTKTFELTFKDIRLYTGKYKIGLWLGDNMSGAHVDYVKFCAQFNVVDGSPLVNRNLRPTSGFHFFTPDWKISDK
ncbi:MAG: ABC transporter ATP-binding protein [Putridiphycobacter sp.]